MTFIHTSILMITLATDGGQETAPAPRPVASEPSEPSGVSEEGAIKAVQEARLEVRGKPGRSKRNVRDCVAWFEKLYPKGSKQGYQALGWSARPGKGSKWIVTLKLKTQGEKVETRWEYDATSGAVDYLDHLSKFLSWVP